MKDKLPISAIIVCLNEEQNIERCIKSVINIVDEVIVIDTGSIDNTLFISQKNGAKTFTSKWLGYGGTKNYATSLAKNKWILSLDADEELNIELKSALLKVNLSNYNCIYTLNRLMFYQGHWIKYGGWYPDKVLRLYPSHKAKWSTHKVHEKLIHDLKIYNLSGHLNHYSYKSIDDQKARIEHYSILKAQQLIASNKTISFSKRYFGPSFKFLKEYILKQGFRNGPVGFTIAKMNYFQAKREIYHYDNLK